MPFLLKKKEKKRKREEQRNRLEVLKMLGESVAVFLMTFSPWTMLISECSSFFFSH